MLVLDAPNTPTLEPQPHTSPSDTETPDSSLTTHTYTLPQGFTETECFTTLPHRNQTVLCIKEGRIPLTSHPRTTPTNPLSEFKQAARELSKPGFRITAYHCHRGNRDRIKVEVQGTRTNGRHAWKRTKLCNTQDEALEFIHTVRKEVTRTKHELAIGTGMKRSGTARTNHQTPALE